MTLRLYMAPMLGITDAAFRKAHEEVYGGFDEAISPFVRTKSGERYSKATFADLLRHGPGRTVITPQILTNQAKDFIALAKILFDEGFAHINFNMGCPVPTAAGRGQGAGLIPDVDFVDRFLNDVLTEIPNLLSIKTRLGLQQPTELQRLTKVFNRYPLKEVVIHPRTAQQGYRGELWLDEFEGVCAELDHEIIFSGDITRAPHVQDLVKRFPTIKGWMIGRGILMDPDLPRQIRSHRPHPQPLYAVFLRRLAGLYQKRKMSVPTILGRLKILALYRLQNGSAPKESLRNLRRSRTLEELICALDEAVPADGRQNLPTLHSSYQVRGHNSAGC